MEIKEPPFFLQPVGYGPCPGCEGDSGSDLFPAVVEFSHKGPQPEAFLLRRDELCRSLVPFAAVLVYAEEKFEMGPSLGRPLADGLSHLPLADEGELVALELPEPLHCIEIREPRPGTVHGDHRSGFR
ncbi:hypothetical protein SDC9_67068 [bioreactor metagenome]|uniref:Uncharacterized protein n=1 Tax=bioreactor metagenome TaxID=1076179 RepID=A0A644Y277_9ZZZZ